MTYGFGFGRGFGAGFGFRGSSPPWPYVGRGRGGLPKCAYPGLYAGPPYGGALGPPYYERQPGYGAAAYAPPVSREEELEFLKEEANSIKTRLDGIQARMKDLVGEKITGAEGS